LKRRSFNLNPFGLWAVGFFVLAGWGQFFFSRQEEPVTLWLGAAFYAMSLFAVWKAFAVKAPTLSSRPIVPPGREAVLFILILGLGILYRLPQADFPEGIFADRAEVANGALRILNGHWRPFLEALRLHVPELPIYYGVAGWFALFGSAPDTYAYFDMALSLAGFALAYVFFRQVTGVFPALLAFFLLAVMRWNFVFAHQIYFQAQSVAVLAGALAAFYHALKADRVSYAAVSGAIAALGLYAYQACKAVPLLVLVLVVFELFKDREDFRKKARLWWALGITFFAVATPYFYQAALAGDLGRRESEVSVLTSIHQAKNLSPLAVNFVKQALMFNRQADNNTQADFDRHRMLDDGTGILFVLGFFYALTRLRERPFFLAVAGVAVMSLPSVFSVDAGHAGRTLGATPFVALICSIFVEAVWIRAAALKVSRGFRRIGGVALGLLLGFIVWGNFHDYFEVQRQNAACQNDCSWAETRVGERIAEDTTGTTDYFLPSRFYGHPTVQYLTQDKADRIHPFDVSNLPKPVDQGHGFCFLLEDSKSGTADFLSHEYPGSRVETLADPLGETALYEISVPAAALARLKRGEPRVSRGLLGVYAHAEGSSEKPFLIRRDPLINFNFRDLPETGTPLFIHWRAQLRAPRSGTYEFLVITNGIGKARLLIDGKGTGDFAVNPPGSATLVQGAHPLDLYFEQGPTALATIHLLWKKPGQAQFTFVSNRDFSVPRP
jgi:hypothetical protein